MTGYQSDVAARNSFRHIKKKLNLGDIGSTDQKTDTTSPGDVNRVEPIMKQVKILTVSRMTTKQPTLHKSVAPSVKRKQQ